MVQRGAAGVELVPAVGIKNIFLRDWKLHFFDSARKRVAAISFIRNIIEYTRGDDNADYETLTALLHWKARSEGIRHGDLDRIYNATFAESGAWTQPDALVVDTIRTEAAQCMGAPEGTNFENKIVLAIATRLDAEKFMMEEIADPTFLEGIASNQTGRLLGRYRRVAGVTPESIEVLDRVALMTPENIHLNSFMYEPIVDMADDHLRKLYQAVTELPAQASTRGTRKSARSRKRGPGDRIKGA